MENLTITETASDMFNMDVDGITNPCNVLGGAGAGLSKIFKQLYPDNHKAYKKACFDRTLVRGKVLMTFNPDRQYPWIFNFPAKPDYSINSTLDDIRVSMPDFILKVKESQEMGLRSIAICALGSGLGGLNFNDVRPIIINGFQEEEWKLPLAVYLIPPK